MPESREPTIQERIYAKTMRRPLVDNQGKIKPLEHQSDGYRELIAEQRASAADAAARKAAVDKALEHG
jgi:hypothetical protein